jgi:hypothetical protein
MSLAKLTPASVLNPRLDNEGQKVGLLSTYVTQEIPALLSNEKRHDHQILRLPHSLYDPDNMAPRESRSRVTWTKLPVCNSIG